MSSIGRVSLATPSSLSLYCPLAVQQVLYEDEAMVFASNYFVFTMLMVTGDVEGLNDRWVPIGALAAQTAPTTATTAAALAADTT